MPAKLLYLVTEDWFFLSHRLPMARAAREAGYEVVVATRIGDKRAAIEAEGFRVVPLRWRRGIGDPASEIASVVEIARVYRRERPDIVHHVSLKPTVVGGLAARLVGVPHVVNAITGFGFAVAARAPMARLFRFCLMTLLPLVTMKPGARLLLQNEDDRAFAVRSGLAPAERTVMIPGSGVDTAAFRPLPPPEQDADGPAVAIATRMLEYKGVPLAVEAVRRLRRDGTAVRLILAGATDPENRASLSPAAMRAYAGEPGITWRGRLDDVRPLWQEAAIALLPPRGGEGVPKSLIEAAACGRPLIATDVPGCRDICRHEETGLLVPPDDADALAAAIRRLIEDPQLARRLGWNARRLAVERFGQELIGEATVALYRSILSVETDTIRVGEHQTA